MTGTITVGTSSWADPGFVAEWYPPGLPARRRLGWYAQRFEAVELNASFYAIPEAGQAARWCEQTPPHFTFDVKLHRLLSRHATPPEALPPDLRGEVEVTPRGRVRATPELEAEVAERVLAAIAPLEAAGKLGALLLQLSPAFDPERHELAELDALLARCAPRVVAVELRHRGWVSDRRVAETLSYLSERDAAFVCVDAPRADSVTIMPPIDAVTCDRVAYLRAHGRDAEGYLHGETVAERFGWTYDDEELAEIAGRARTLAGEAKDVRVRFNNNRGRDAPASARRFRELLGQPTGPPPDPQPRQLRLV